MRHRDSSGLSLRLFQAGTSAGMAPFDFRSAPASPHTSALDLASYSLSPRPGSLPAGFNAASMGHLAAQHTTGLSASAQQAIGLMGGEDFLSASAGAPPGRRRCLALSVLLLWRARYVWFSDPTHVGE